MAILQVRDIDDSLYDSLKNLAKKEHRSLSQEVIKIIESYFQHPAIKEINATEEFLKLSGSWEDNKKPDEIIKDIRSSRRKNKRFKNVLFD